MVFIFKVLAIFQLYLALAYLFPHILLRYEERTIDAYYLSTAVSRGACALLGIFSSFYITEESYQKFWIIGWAVISLIVETFLFLSARNRERVFRDDLHRITRFKFDLSFNGWLAIALACLYLSFIGSITYLVLWQ